MNAGETVTVLLSKMWSICLLLSIAPDVNLITLDYCLLPSKKNASLVLFFRQHNVIHTQMFTKLTCPKNTKGGGGEHTYINNSGWPSFCAAEWFQICESCGSPWPFLTSRAGKIFIIPTGSTATWDLPSFTRIPSGGDAVLFRSLQLKRKRAGKQTFFTCVIITVTSVYISSPVLSCQRFKYVINPAVRKQEAGTNWFSVDRLLVCFNL